MFITRTPFRVSLFGGGTDLSRYFQINGGHVISMGINKYCYVTSKKLPEIADHNIRFSYSKVESCQNIDELKHPLVRAALNDLNINKIEINYDADLPRFSGLGTSSSFAVGLANSLYGFKGELKNKEELANKAIFWERKLLKEKGGYQDQIAAAFGGLNYIKFYDHSSYTVNPLPISLEKIKELESRLLLVYIPKIRFSSDYSVENQINNSETIKNLDFIKDIVNEAIIYFRNFQFDNLGELLDQNWKYKRQIAKTTNTIIDQVYDETKKAGAIGSKLLGAGGGGFMLTWCKAGERNNVQNLLKNKNISTLKFKIDFEGSKFLYINR